MHRGYMHTTENYATMTKNLQTHKMNLRNRQSGRGQIQNAILQDVMPFVKFKNMQTNLWFKRYMSGWGDCD